MAELPSAKEHCYECIQREHVSDCPACGLVLAYGKKVLAAAADEIADCFENEEHYLEVRVMILKLKEN